MDYIIFRNPLINFRGEKFGGIVKSKGSFYSLGKKEFALLKRIKHQDYSSLSQEERQIMDKFISFNIFLKIEKVKAKGLVNLFTKHGRKI